MYEKGSFFLYILTNTCCCLSFWWKPLWHMVDDISWWFGFTFPWWLAMLSFFACACWPYICLLWKNVYSSHQPVFLFWFSYSWFELTHTSYCILHNFVLSYSSNSKYFFILPNDCVCVWVCVCVCSVASDSLWSHGLNPARLLCSWNFPGKNTGASCHFLLQGLFLT